MSVIHSEGKPIRTRSQGPGGAGRPSELKTKHMEVFELEDVVKFRGPGFTLGPLSLRLGAGEILGIMGPNGAGKTTLLKLLWGFLRPDGGEIKVFGYVPHLEQVAVRIRAGYLAESPHFYEWMTAERFLLFIAGFYPSWDWSRAYELLEEFGLEASKQIDRLSKGNRIKLALIAAVSHRPQLLILDEPTSGLDPVVRVDILETLRRMAREANVGIVLSSHVSDDLDRIADTILMLDAGSVLEYAPTTALLERYGRHQLEEVFLNAIGRIPTTGTAHRA